MSSRLDRIEDWDREAIRARYRVTTLAIQCQVTGRQLQRYIFNKFGSAPHVWLMRKQLKTAETFLSEGASVKEAACQAGFSREDIFSRRFKQYYDITPKEFRVRQNSLK